MLSWSSGARKWQRLGLSALLLACLLTGPPVRAKEAPKCIGAHLVLWGDGKHDDTAALNAWFAGETVVWGETQKPAGPEIADRDFLLSSAVYIPSGTGRRLERFEMVWPHRGERVSGGAIASGTDPDAPPVASGITKVNGDAGEGVPFEAPAAETDKPPAALACLVS